MPKKKFSAEQIVAKLGQVEVLLAQVKTIAIAPWRKSKSYWPAHQRRARDKIGSYAVRSVEGWFCMKSQLLL